MNKNMYISRSSLASLARNLHEMNVSETMAQNAVGILNEYD